MVNLCNLLIQKVVPTNNIILKAFCCPIFIVGNGCGFMFITFGPLSIPNFISPSSQGRDYTSFHRELRIMVLVTRKGFFV